jgi:hypothetical protein
MRFFASLAATTFACALGAPLLADDKIAMDDDVVVVPATVAPPPPATPAPEPPDRDRAWYGETILLAGALTTAAMTGGFAMMMFGESKDTVEGGIAISTLGTIAHMASGPTIHAFASDEAPRAWASFGLRGSFLSFISVSTAVACQDGCTDGAYVGAVGAAAFAPVLLEMVAVAWRDVPQEAVASGATIVPYAVPVPGGAVGGVGGVF